MVVSDQNGKSDGEVRASKEEQALEEPTTTAADDSEVDVDLIADLMMESGGMNMNNSQVVVADAVEEEEAAMVAISMIKDGADEHYNNMYQYHQDTISETKLRLVHPAQGKLLTVDEPAPDVEFSRAVLVPPCVRGVQKGQELAEDIQPIPGDDDEQDEESPRPPERRVGAHAVQTYRADMVRTTNAATTANAVTALVEQEGSPVVVDHHAVINSSHLIEAQLVETTTGADDSELVVAERMDEVPKPQEEEDTTAPRRPPYVPLAAAIIVLLLVAIIVLLAVQNKASVDVDEEEGMMASTTMGSNQHHDSSMDSDHNSGPHLDTASTTETGQYFHCVHSVEELRETVDKYYLDDSPDSHAAERFGWPMGKWCIRYVRDLSRVFQTDRSRSSEVTAHESDAIREMAQDFVVDLGGWGVSKVAGMEQVFRGVQTMSSEWGIHKWNVARVTTFQGLFMDTVWLPEQPQDASHDFLSSWDTQSLTNLDSTFQRATSFDQSIGSWNVSSVKTLQNAFQGASAFNQDLSSWDVSSMESLQGAFQGASSFQQDLCAWASLLPMDANTTGMFEGTACPNTSDPILSQGGPFCFNCQ
ncbi:(LipO)protein [Seminavis robusta]|uniref:(LipO)protein n=1 Tax=Seminavis robusta TaxID=568900 RepID=A0A9N8DR57_9STRA|nr:(LipO)protein [Seminavis robusta]|eukprot:Sro223_g091370.1 (LipO)protein (588) ;mRNA; r:37893-39656